MTRGEREKETWREGDFEPGDKREKQQKRDEKREFVRRGQAQDHWSLNG